MTGLLNAIRLDHQIMRARYPVLLLLLAIGVAVGSLADSPVTAIVLVTLITGPIGGTFFAVYETSRLDHLFGTLPLRRGAAVAGIYAHTALLLAGNGLLAALISWQIGLQQDVSISGGTVAVTLALSFLAGCLYIGLLFPVYLATTFSKVYILTNVPFYLVAVFITYVAKRTDWLSRLGPVVDFFHDYPAGASALSVAAGLIILSLSWAVGQRTAAARR